MKNKILTLATLISLSAVLFGACNSNNSNNESADSGDHETSQGMGTVQTDTLPADSTNHNGDMRGDMVR